MGRKKRETVMTRVNHFLATNQIERIDALASITGADRSTIIRAAIEAYLDREERRLAKREEKS